ncbi:MAG: tyrosine-type recombinase/integrase [Solirubrobacteraceae bacterium]
MQLVRDYIEPRFGGMSAAKLDAELLETLYAHLGRCKDLSCNGKKHPGHACKPLSSSTIRQIHFILRSSLDRSVRWGYIGINPAALAEPPSVDDAAPDPPSAEEAAALLNEAWNEPWWGLLLWLVMVTGCRRGELCAVRWADLDLTRGVLTLEHSAYQSKTKGLHVKKTKSKQKRRIALDSQTVELLMAK